MNPIDANIIDYTKAFYPVDENNALSVHNSLFTPLINFRIPGSDSQVLNNAMFNAQIMFPTSMNVTSDLCLAKLVDSVLTCVYRDVIIRKNWVQMPISETGTYALIFNPNLNLKLGITDASEATSATIPIPTPTPTLSP